MTEVDKLGLDVDPADGVAAEELSPPPPDSTVRFALVKRQSQLTTAIEARLAATTTGDLSADVESRPVSDEARRAIALIEELNDCIALVVDGQPDVERVALDYRASLVDRRLAGLKGRTRRSALAEWMPWDVDRWPRLLRFVPKVDQATVKLARAALGAGRIAVVIASLEGERATLSEQSSAFDEVIDDQARALQRLRPLIRELGSLNLPEDTPVRVLWREHAQARRSEPRNVVFEEVLDDLLHEERGPRTSGTLGPAQLEELRERGAGLERETAEQIREIAKVPTRGQIEEEAGAAEQAKAKMLGAGIWVDHWHEAQTQLDAWLTARTSGRQFPARVRMLLSSGDDTGQASNFLAQSDRSALSEALRELEQRRSKIASLARANGDRRSSQLQKVIKGLEELAALEVLIAHSEEAMHSGRALSPPETTTKAEMDLSLGSVPLAGFHKPPMTQEQLHYASHVPESAPRRLDRAAGFGGAGG
ncbi:MAG: hypothetical protein M3396_07215 [Actinomycetota bacterium]|nr:hypothetical protein [Actinomycetota bacterium]MDQ3573733.1 hypothetical protein [Actinomycetota bacterium]